MPEGELLWEPSRELRERACIAGFMERRGFDSYDELWRWSVEDLADFWGSLWDEFEIIAASPYERVLGRHEMPGAEWFPGARLNYAEHVFRMARPGETAIVHASELRPLSELDWDELRAQAAVVLDLESQVVHLPALQLHRDTPIGNRVRQAPDAGERLRAKRLEVLNVEVLANTERSASAASVASVQHPTRGSMSSISIADPN